jgi:putative flavoprotein involved in K+ transport
VLVVGGSHSGADIAYEVAADHRTILCGRDPGQIPVRLESPMFKLVFPALLFMFGRVLSRRTPIGRKEMQEIRHHGGPMLRVKRADLTERGVERVHERVVGVEDGKPVLDGGRVVDVGTVIWCTGFRHDFSWLEPDVLQADGWPRELRGVVEEAPGLYFCGLAFQSSGASMFIAGKDRDTGFVARHIARRMQTTRTTAGVS